MAHVFPAAIVLTLAWASGTIMGAVGTDRMFAAWITDGIAYESLPTLSFVISFFVALATGTSWGTMARQRQAQKNGETRTQVFVAHMMILHRLLCSLS
jgi:lipoprotein signal peptidase